MSNYFIEGASPKEHDSNERSLQKINSLLYNAVDAAGKLQIGGVQLDNLNVNTDQIESKQDTTNAILTTTAADVATVKTNTPALVGGRVPVDIGSASVTISGPVTVSNEVEVKNDTGNPVPVSGTVTVSNQPTSISVSNFPATQPVSGTVGISGTVPVSASSLPLPSGASTSALQTIANTSLATIANVTKGGGAIDANTQRVTLATDGPGVSNLASIAANTTPLSGVTQTSSGGKVGLDVNVISGGGGGGGTTTLGTSTASIGSSDSMGIPVHSYRTVNYSGGNISSIQYYTGGSGGTGGTLVKTKTFTYSGGNLSQIIVS